MALKNKYEVIIVGYGPLGQLCGLLLSKLGVKTAIIERKKDVNPLPRASVVDGESLRFTNTINIYSEIKNLFNTPEFLDYSLPNGKIIQRSIVRETSDGYTNVSTFYQPDLEVALRKKVSESDRIDLYLQHELISFKEEKDKISVKFKDISKNKLIEIESNYLLACDGVNSSIRKKLKISSEDLKYNKDWLIVDIDTKDKSLMNNTIRQICDFERPTSFTFLSNKRYRWEFQLLPGEKRDEMLQDKKIFSLLEKYIDKNIYSINRKDIYKFKAECSRHWLKNKIILLGGAAYQLPPFGYQSLNSEIRDINNLCWKLSLVLKNKCKPDILLSYNAEREPVAKETISSSLAMGQLIDSIAVSFKKNIPLEESVPPEARIQAFKDSRNSLAGAEKNKKIFYDSDVTKSFSSSMPNFYMMIDKKRVLFDNLLGLNFCIFTAGKYDFSKKIFKFLEEINAKIYDTNHIVCEDTFMKESFKNHSFIIRPDRKIFGVTDNYNSLEIICEDLMRKLFYINQR